MKDVDGTQIDDFNLEEQEEQKKTESGDETEKVIRDILLDDETGTLPTPEELKTAEDEVEEDFDEDEDDPYDGYEEDEEEDDDTLSFNPLLIIPVVLCMLLLAAGITTIIWNIKHPDRKVSALFQKGNSISILNTGIELMPSEEEPLVVIEAYASKEPVKIEADNPRPVQEAESSEQSAEQEPDEIVDLQMEIEEGMVDGQMQNPVVEEYDENGVLIVKESVVTKEGVAVTFTLCDDLVTPKYYADLRTEPSTYQGNASVACRVNAGEVLHRRAYETNTGWSCVERDGKILYVLTEFMNTVEPAPPEPEVPLY